MVDATAILAVLFEEAGSDSVAALLDGALLSAVNLSEVYGSLLRRGVDAALAWDRLLELGCEICPMDEEQARIAGELAGRPLAAMSLGDRACLALGVARKATVYTTIAEWKDLRIGVEVQVIR